MTDRLGIGIDIRTFAPRAGQNAYLWRLGSWLARRGHRVELITVKPQPDEIGETSDGVRLHRLADASRAELRRRVADLDLDALLINPERARRYRGIRANVLRPGYGTEHYSQKLRSFRSAPRRLLRRLIRLAPWTLAEQRWERRFYEAPEPPPRVVANSRYTRREVLASYTIPESHVHVVHNGIDTDLFSPGERVRRRDARRAEWGIPEDAVCLLFLANNFRLKGLWQTLEVIARVRGGSGTPDLHALVVGGGTGALQRWKARRLVRRHGLEDAVHIVGRVFPAIDAMAAADLFIHLSWHDSFGFVILEAMASGLPVITTPFAGASELIDDGESGLIIDPGRTDDIEAAVRRLMDRDIRDAIGAAAAAVGAEHTEERSFRGILEVMERAARDRSPVR